MNIKLLAVIAVLAGAGALVCAGGLKAGPAAVKGRLADNIALPFVADASVLGVWESVDFVTEPEDFRPGIRQFGGDLYLKGLTFKAGGKMLPGLCYKWTKGVVLDSCDTTASSYLIREIGGATFMFFEWKSGDYTIRHMKPEYYVLKKK
jgi:bla regulator protein BlaR1